MSEYITVHFHLFRPHKALWKQVRNDKAEAHSIRCCNADNCDLHKRGECSFLISFGPCHCPYGQYSRHVGFTKRASKYHSWIKAQETKYEGIPHLNAPKVKLAIVGDYVFLPYSFLKLHKDIKWSGLFIPKASFTVDLIKDLVHFKPCTLFGEEITDYQKKVPPVLLRHLSECCPELFHQVIKEDDYAYERFQESTYIGRTAVLETLNPNVGTYIDCHNASWTWDGQQLHSTDSHASFMLVSKFTKISITPEKGQSVKVTDNAQVNENTIFID